MIRCKAKDICMEITNHFKKNLNKYLESNATLNDASIKLSQELDKLIVREQLKQV
jgi:hypothetical protein